MPSQLYALRVDATADEGSQCNIGQRRSLLVLAKAGSQEEASNIAMVALAEYRWTDAQMHNVAPVNVRPSAMEDRTIREAALHAENNGYAVVVF
jgi:hypothetical protein